MASGAPVERMVSELLATGLLGESDISDVTGYLEQWRAGTLHPDDLAYLTALHRRLLDPERVDEVEEIAAVTTDWRARAERAEAEAERLRALLARHGIADDPLPTGRVADEGAAVADVAEPASVGGEGGPDRPLSDGRTGGSPVV